MSSTLLKPLRQPRVQRTVLAAALSAMIAGQVSYANGIDTMLGQMYTAAGQPSVTTNGKMTTVQTGYIAMRTDLQSFTIFAINPPNFSVGCGGMDAYFGSFSFINAQELENLVKAIGQDALPFLFMDALDSMCPNCYKELQNFLDQLQKMNSLVENSCQIARGIFTDKGSPELLSNVASGFFKNLNASTGIGSFFDNWFGSTNPDSSTQPETAANNALNAATSSTGAPATTAEQTTVIGNNTWKGIVNNNMVALLNPSNPNSAKTAEILMSLIGVTDVELGSSLSTPAPTSTGNAQSATTTSPNPDEGGQKLVADLTLDDLIKGNASAPYLVCAPTTIGKVSYTATGGGGTLDPSACRKVVTSGADTLGSGPDPFLGTDAMVSCAIFGTTGQTATTCPAGSDGGIVANMLNGISSATWAPLDKEIWAQSPIPFVPLMARLGGNPALQGVIASYAYPFVKANVAANFGIQVRAAVQNTFQNAAGEAKYKYPEGYHNIINQMTQTIDAQSKILQNSVQESNQLTAFVNAYLESLHPYVPGAGM